MSHHTRRNTLPRLTPLLAAAVFTVAIVYAPISVRADTFEEQIKVLEQKIKDESNKKAEIGKDATSQIKTVNDLINQLARLQALIGQTAEQKSQTESELTELEKAIPAQRQALSEAMRDLNIDKSITPLEMIASSKNLSEFMDKFESRQRIKELVHEKVGVLQEQQRKIASKQGEVTKLLAEQTSQQNAVDVQKKVASEKLGITKEQIAELSHSVNQKTVEVAALKQEQAAANTALLAVAAPAESLPPSASTPPPSTASPAPTQPSDQQPTPTTPPSTWQPSRPGMITTYPLGQSGGGYPTRWASVPQDSVADSWGMYNRECVSYTAFRVANSGRFMPRNWVGWIGPRSFDYKGNARYWPRNARSIGIPVDASPRVGDVAISDDGYFGHAMYVEAVYSNGLIKVSQYNFNVRGEYSEMYIYRTNLQFIHF